jgi:hypothetical protein
VTNIDNGQMQDPAPEHKCAYIIKIVMLTMCGAFTTRFF